MAFRGSGSGSGVRGLGPRLLRRRRVGDQVAEGEVDVVIVIAPPPVSQLAA